MQELREELRVGLRYVEAITALLQRVRAAHPTAGSYEAAEIQWWWSIERSTDRLGQLFWFDDVGRPAAAVTVTDFSDGSSALYESPTLVVAVMPDATPDWVTSVVTRGLAHLADAGIGTVELEVDRADEAMRTMLFDRGFQIREDGMVEAWLAADARPDISPLDQGYRLFSRSETTDRPHHMADPRRPDVEQRLRQLSLYRSDLDLVVFDSSHDVAAYGLFWYDPATATGVVEPMRTRDGHRQRGLARHILTTGVDRLVKAGATRISIGFSPDNPASGPLYRSVGFVPHRQTDVSSGPTGAHSA